MSLFVKSSETEGLLHSEGGVVGRSTSFPPHVLTFVTENCREMNETIHDDTIERQ